jgi:predicted PurR-regulated permease PerM
MEIINFTIIGGIFAVFFLLLLLSLIVVFYYLYKINKKIDETNKEISDALVKMITYQSKEFSTNSKTHQEMVDWFHTNFEKFLEYNSQSFNSFQGQLGFISNASNVIMEMLGYKPKFDESGIEKAQVNYGQPPPPKKIEGLRINDRDK